MINPFRGLVANNAQNHDLLNFHSIGKETFENRIKPHILKTPSVEVPVHRKSLQTFATQPKSNKKKIKSLQQEIERIQKCMQRKIAYANKTGTKKNVIGGQYIELPRAM